MLLGIFATAVVMSRAGMATVRNFQKGNILVFPNILNEKC